MKRPLQPKPQRQPVQRHPYLLISHFASSHRQFSPCVPQCPLWLSSSWNAAILQSKIHNLKLRSYCPSSVDRTFSASSALLNGFCRSFTPGSSTLCCTTMSSV